MVSAAELLGVQTDLAWVDRRAVLDGLTDDEFRWEPVAGCWSVRPRAEAGAGWGTGEYVCEDTWPPPEPVPVTTIGWRICHLAGWTEVYLDHSFGSARLGLPDLDAPGDAATAVAWLDDAQARWSNAVRSIDESEVTELRPTHWGGHMPLARIVSDMVIEYAHHLAEIGTLRDIRRGHALPQAPPAELDAPRWWREVR